MKRLSKMVLLVVTLSQLSLASHCTSAVAFLIYAMQLHNAGVISKADVATLTSLKTVTYEEVVGEISNGGLARLGAGDFHVGYEVNTTRVESPLSEVKGQVVVVANGRYSGLIQDSVSNYHEIYSRHMALGILGELALERSSPEAQGKAAKTLRVIIDKDGHPIGRVVTKIDARLLPVKSLPYADRERALAAVLPSLIKLWNTRLFDSPAPFEMGAHGNLLLGAHGDLNLGNIYARVENGKVEWMLTDFGPVPWERCTATTELEFNPNRDRRIIFDMGLSGDPDALSEADLAGLLEEVPHYESWARQIATTPAYKFQIFEFDPQTQKQPQLIHADLKRQNSPALWFYVNSINEAIKSALSKIPDTEVQTKKILNSIVTILTNAVESNDAANADVFWELIRLNQFAKVEWNGSDALKVVFYRNPR